MRINYDETKNQYIINGIIYSPSEAIKFITQNYKKDEAGRLHRKNGQFASKTEMQIFEIEKEVIEVSYSLPSRGDFISKRGKQLSRSYAHYYRFKCLLHKNSPVENPIKKKGEIVSHSVGYSTSSKYPRKETVFNFHNSHYPNHEVLEIQYLYTKEMML